MNKNNHDIDLVNFSSTGEMERIREQERIDREKRKQHAMRVRRAELIRRKKMQRLKETIVAWCIVALFVIVLIAAIIGIVSLFKKDEAPVEQNVGDKILPATSLVVSDFSDSKGIFYGADGTEYAILENAAKEISSTSFENNDAVIHASDLSMIVDAYMWNGNFNDNERIKQIVRDFPLYSNGYVWSSENKMMSPVTSSYLYDTNAAYISAVCGICTWEASGDFLDSVDSTHEEKGDISNTMTVGEKLEAAASHFFDTSDYFNGGGVRYNPEDGLVYVRTPENDGTTAGKPSNIFLNYRFGYVDTYINLTFNKAMQDLEKLYNLLGDKEKADLYSQYAKANREAINKKLYNEKLGRYVACIDDTGKVHDNGFTAINLFALSIGIPEKQQKESINSWLCGQRIIASDNVRGGDILSNGVIPVFTTVAETGDWWSAKGGVALSENTFGNHWLCGAPSMLSANYYLLCAEGNKETLNRADEILDAFSDKKVASSLINGGEPSLHYALVVSNAMRKALGISVDNQMLTLNPGLSEGDKFGIKDINFRGNEYDFLFDGNSVYVMADENEAVKLKLGGFSGVSNVTMTVVGSDEILLTKELTTSADGFVTVSHKFGGDTYIVLEEIQNDK